MSADDARVLQLLEEALDSDRTPEEVCAQTPELLQAVRERWEHCRRLENRLNDLFPSARSSSSAFDVGGAVGGVEDAAARLLNRGAALPSIPGYEVEAVLGHGGVGVVYRARHLGLRRTVALKMLLSGA
jgi:serine/threonine protein kinase